MVAFFFLILGLALGYFWGRFSAPAPISKKSTSPRTPVPHTLTQRIYLKSQHQTDSDRIRELNLLSTQQSAFLRLLKQTFSQHEISIKQQRFFILDRDAFPLAIFEYREGHYAMKLVDQEDGIPLYLYKGLISQDE